MTDFLRPALKEQLTKRLNEVMGTDHYSNIHKVVDFSTKEADAHLHAHARICIEASKGASMTKKQREFNIAMSFACMEAMVEEAILRGEEADDPDLAKRLMPTGFALMEMWNAITEREMASH